MQLYILNPEYEIVGYIDETESTLWHKKYNDVGQCEIYTPCSDEMLEMLKKGNYVFRYDDDMFCKIETVELLTDAEQGDYIIATANDVVKILAGRFALQNFTYSGTLANYILRLINENIINPTDTKRRIANFVFNTSNFDELTETIETTTTDDELLQIIATACKSQNYGFRLSYDMEAGQLVFRLKKGKNKATTDSGEYVEFSPTYSNIISSSYKEDESNYKNVAIVKYEDGNKKIAFTTVYNGDIEPQGEARREIFIDGTKTSRKVTHDEIMTMYPKARRDEALKQYIAGGDVIANYEITTDGIVITLTDTAYLPLVQDVGKQALGKRAKTQEFSGNIDIVDTYSYKNDYDLGDIVKVVNEYGIEAEAMITEVMECEDNEDGYTIEPKFEYQE